MTYNYTMSFEGMRTFFFSLRVGQEQWLPFSYAYILYKRKRLFESAERKVSVYLQQGPNYPIIHHEKKIEYLIFKITVDPGVSNIRTSPYDPLIFFLKRWVKNLFPKIKMYTTRSAKPEHYPLTRPAKLVRIKQYISPQSFNHLHIFRALWV